MVVLYATRFITQQLYVLPTQFIYKFLADLRTNRDYSRILH
jgi:hypothetical protein